MQRLVLGRAGASLTIVPYPTLDELVRAFDGQHVGLGFFKIRVGLEEIYLDREEPEMAAAVGPELGQHQQRIYSVAAGADAFAALLRAAKPDVEVEIRDCRVAAVSNPDLCREKAANPDTAPQPVLLQGGW